MTLSIYDVTVPALVRGLDVVAAYLDKAGAYAAEKKLDPASLVEARLFPDMYPLSGQVQRVSDTSKAAVGRLTGMEMPSFPDVERTLEELKGRVAKTIEFVKSAKREQFEASESRRVELKFRSGPVVFDGESYVMTYVLPNFYFHVTTVHDILRSKGVSVGKLDYLGPLGFA